MDKIAFVGAKDREQESFFGKLQQRFDELNTKSASKYRALVSLTNAGAKSRILLIGESALILKKPLEQAGARHIALSCSFDQAVKCKNKIGEDVKVYGDNLAVMAPSFDIAIIYGAFDGRITPPEHIYGLLEPGGRVCVCNAAGRPICQGAQEEPMLPTTAKLAARFGCFEADILIDTPHLYMFSGVKKPDVKLF